MRPQARGRPEPQELGAAGWVPPGPEGQERCQHRDFHIRPPVRCFKPSTLCHWPRSPGTPVHVDTCVSQGQPQPPLGEGQERVQTGSRSQAPGTAGWPWAGPSPGDRDEGDEEEEGAGPQPLTQMPGPAH